MRRPGPSFHEMVGDRGRHFTSTSDRSTPDERHRPRRGRKREDIAWARAHALWPSGIENTPFLVRRGHRVPRHPRVDPDQQSRRGDLEVEPGYARLLGAERPLLPSTRRRRRALALRPHREAKSPDPHPSHTTGVTPRKWKRVAPRAWRSGRRTPLGHLSPISPNGEESRLLLRKHRTANRTPSPLVVTRPSLIATGVLAAMESHAIRFERPRVRVGRWVSSTPVECPRHIQWSRSPQPLLHGDFGSSSPRARA